MKKQYYSYQRYIELLETATTKNVACGIISLAMNQWRENELSAYQLAGIFTYASEKIRTIKQTGGI